MLKLVLAAAVALTAAAPAVAQNQLERGLGVSPGAFTTSELAVRHLKSSTDSYNEQRTVSGGGTMRFTTSGAHSARAQAIFDRLRAESLEDE